MSQSCDILEMPCTCDHCVLKALLYGVNQALTFVLCQQGCSLRAEWIVISNLRI